ncbi:MAG TPA: SGNH/GDSL hydrolase family protein [Planctomycetaceae bacterium]|nr:SGNH/GDSL hydrolase family protein [Planctomycetaceae bacterium]
MVRIRLAWIKHFLSAVVLLVLLAGALELGLRLVDPSQPGSPSARPGDDPLTMPCWLMHHRLRPMAKLSVPSPDRDSNVEVRTNSFSLRGPEPAVPKPAGVYRIVCLGDETVLAPEIDEQRTFCRRLEELLQPHTRFRLEVINAGVPGYCPLLSSLQARHAVFALQPDVIVLHVDMSDIADDHQYRRFLQTDETGAPVACPHPELERPPTRAGGGWLDRLQIACWCRRQFVALPESAAGAADRLDIDARSGRYAWLRDDPPDWTVYIEQALAPVSRLAQAADQVYARLVLATCPVPWQVSPTAAGGARNEAGVPENAHYRSRAPFEQIAAFAARRRILFRDASSVFQHSPDPDTLYLQNSRGLSEQGHELYARQLAACLLEHVPGVWITEPPPYRPDERHDPTRQALNEPSRR